MQTYRVSPVTIMLERNNSFAPVVMDFEFSLDFDTIVPETDEEAEIYHNCIARTIKFLQGINNGFILETTYPETELFVTQRINNISIEVPDNCNKVPLIGLILFKKVRALMCDFKVESFSLEFFMNDSQSDSIKTKLEYTDDNLKDSKLMAVLQHYEDEWTQDIVSDYDDASEEGILDDSISQEDLPTTPWWNRNDGNVRDFINMDVESFDSLKDKEMSIRILTVDIDDDPIMFIPDDGEDPDEPTQPTDDDGYYKI